MAVSKVRQSMSGSSFCIPLCDLQRHSSQFTSIVDLFRKGRRLLFSELLQMSGGEFGDGFDPARVTRTVVGTAAFTWTGCDEGFMDWTIGDEMGRQELSRLTNLSGLQCSPQQDPPVTIGQGLSGAWYEQAFLLLNCR